MAASKAPGSEPLMCNELPKATACRRPAVLEFVGEFLQVRARNRPGFQMRVSDHFIDRTSDQEVSVGE